MFPNQITSNLSLYSLNCAEACNELAGPIFASLRPGNSAPFEEMSQRWRAVGNPVSDLTGLRFKPQTYRFRDERVTARPTGRFCFFFDVSKNYKKPHFLLQFFLALILDTARQKQFKLIIFSAFFEATKIFKRSNDESDNDRS